MTKSPSTAVSNQSQEKKKSFWDKLRDSVKSTAGLITGLATIVTAVATIIGVLLHGWSRPSPVPTVISTRGAVVTPARGATTIPPRGTTPSSPEEARIQWGPGSLLLTNDGTSLASVPPGNNQDVVGDVYAGGYVIEPFAGTTLVIWANGGQPTAQQCSNLTATQGNAGQSVSVVPGSVVCAATSEGPIAIIDVESINAADLTIETRTTVWDLAGS
jgi:hypothetical protein